MHRSIVKFTQSWKPASRRLTLAAVLAVAGIGLSGCVVYPDSYGYGYGGGGYYAAPVYAPTVVVGGGWGWGGGWGRRGWR